MEQKPNTDRLTADAAELLKDMIAIPSPSFSEEEVCAHICRWLNEKGITHERVGRNIIAEHIVDAENPTLMLCAHIDTVNASPEYSFDPFQPDYETAAKAIASSLGEDCREDEIVAGLGSNDDGASVVAMIAAYRYFQQIAGVGGGMGRPNLVLVLTCEEERSGKSGMTGLWGTRFCRRGETKEGCRVIDYAIVGEPTGMKAATSERGLLVIDAEAHGISGHAARNEGKNALYIALEDIDRIRNHTFGKISPRMGKVNLNVTQINAGSAHNVIPDLCSFVIDIRPTEQYTNEEIFNELQALCESELKPRNLANRSSATFEGSHLQKTAESLDIDTFSSPTTSDWMRIDCDAIKMGPGESSRSHRKDEFVFVEEIKKGIETYIEFINLL
ncbi:MAG: M20/M25/M40 family metallo-hydrolase [Bacteroidales bacterium]|nr:M20/M25/M40 family metallo-hydrolase [Bacteroidales bacterium]